VLQPHIEKLPVVIDSIPPKSTAAEVVAAAVKSGSLTATGMISRTSSANKTEKPLDETRNVRRIQLIYGKDKGQHMKAVDGTRRVNIFMTRFDPNVTSTDIEALIKDAVPNCTGVKVEKQPTRYETYSSFSAELCVTRTNFDNLRLSVYSADSWPDGILVRRFYRTKHGGTQQ